MLKRANAKGQLALEFMLTYGWAVMVAMIAIAVLAYFGILNPDKFAPRGCVMESGIACLDSKVDEGSVSLVLKNGRGEDISISGVKIETCSGTDNGILKNGEQKQFVVGGCNNAAGSKFMAKFNVTYTGETSLIHKNHGKIVDVVEAGPSTPTGFFYWITTTQQEFDEGAYFSVQSVPAGSVQLSSGASYGTYTSKIFDADAVATWK